jgi:hypothetical protein
LQTSARTTTHAAGVESGVWPDYQEAATSPGVNSGKIESKTYKAHGWNFSLHRHHPGSQPLLTTYNSSGLPRRAIYGQTKVPLQLIRQCCRFHTRRLWRRSDPRRNGRAAHACTSTRTHAVALAGTHAVALAGTHAVALAGTHAVALANTHACANTGACACANTHAHAGTTATAACTATGYDRSACGCRVRRQPGQRESGRVRSDVLAVGIHDRRWNVDRVGYR